MSLDEIATSEKEKLYGTKADKNNALDCLNKYRLCISLYNELQDLVEKIDNLDGKKGKLRDYLKCKIMAKKLDKYWKEWKKYESFYNASIPISANVPASTVFPHQLSNIFISAHSKIGEGCIIFQGVTIGSNTLSDSKNHGSPTIGNNVYIGSGATIIGNITIGDNVRIGANTTVTKSVPDNMTCISQPSILIKHIGKKENRKW